MELSSIGTPKEIKFCKICVISNQRPSSVVEFKHQLTDKKPTININPDSICDACLYAKKKNEIDWDQREKELKDLLDNYRSSSGNYDVIVPGSGGKDSAFTAHILKYKYGMNPLTVTWAPHKYTDVGWKNFINWSHIGGLDNILFTPNGRLHRYLTKKAFENLLHPFQPFIIGQRIIGPLFASKFKVPLVMYGENQAEYGNKIDENQSNEMKSDFFISKNLNDLIISGCKIKDIINETDFSISDFKPYLPITNEDNFNQKISVKYLGYFLKWDPQECYYYASENTGFSSNDERTEGSYSKYSSIDDKIDPFHYYTTLIKFGIGRATYDACQEIRNDKITREEAISLVKQFDEEFPSKFYQEFLEYISLSDIEFDKIIDRYRSSHLWEKVNNTWKLKKAVWHKTEEIA